MLTWCSWCQKFIGESFPYDDFRITHGMCGECKPNSAQFSEEDLARARLLQGIQSRLFDAGLSQGIEAADSIVDEALKSNVRAVDILTGLVAPVLYQLGEDWRRGTRRLEEEIRLIAFCEQMFERIATRVRAATLGRGSGSTRAEVLLMNAPGNLHTLGIRILALTLEDKGVRPHVVEGSVGTEELVALVRSKQPRLLLISVALLEQRAGVLAIVERLATLPESIRPRIVVGGYAVKLNLIPAIHGADLIPDFSALQASLRTVTDPDEGDAKTRGPLPDFHAPRDPARS